MRKGRGCPGVGPWPTFWSLMFDLGTVTAPLSVPFSLLMCYNELYQGSRSSEDDLSAILDPFDVNSFMLCPWDMSKVVPCPFPSCYKGASGEYSPGDLPRCWPRCLHVPDSFSFLQTILWSRNIQADIGWRNFFKVKVSSPASRVVFLHPPRLTQSPHCLGAVPGGTGAQPS